jgi:hypothetical protein
MGKLDNIFKKIADASVTGGGNNIRDGLYLLAVDKCILNDEAHSGTCFIVEFRVLEASPSGAVDENGKPVLPNPVGTTCSMVCNVSKHESAFGNLKKFLIAALAGVGYSADQVTDELIKQMFLDEPEMLRGVVVRDETYRGVNKGRANPANAGKPLTLNKWMTVEQTEEDIEAMKAFLDKNAPKAEVATKTEETKPAAATAPAKTGLLGAMKRS